ncbi:hypothetical protein D3C80_1108410 [compost metagenome]
MQQRQGKGNIFGLDWRAVAVDQIRPQFNGVDPVVRADLPGLCQPRHRLALAVQTNQSGKDHVGDVLIPAIAEQIGIEVTLRFKNTGHHGVFTQLGRRRHQAGIAGRGNTFRQGFRLHAKCQPHGTGDRQRNQSLL